MKTFIFLYHGGIEQRPVIISALNNCKTVTIWRYDMIGSFYLTSNSTAKQISTELSKLIPEIGRHLVTELGEDYWGVMTPATWAVLQKQERLDSDK